MSGRQWRDLWIEQVNVNPIWLAKIVNKVLGFYLVKKWRNCIWSVSGGICWCWYPSGYWSLKWRGISSLRYWYLGELQSQEAAATFMVSSNPVLQILSFVSSTKGKFWASDMLSEGYNSTLRVNNCLLLGWKC